MPDTQKILALIIVLAFIGLIIFWTVIPPPGDPAQISGMINTLIGILAGSATAVVGFYFGSSSGSKEKDTTMSNIATKATEAANGRPSDLPPLEGDPGGRA